MNDTAPGRTRCLERAHEAVVERAGAYGPPIPFFAAVARRWSLTLGVEVRAQDVVLCLIDMKMERAKAGGGVDTFGDIAGYAAIGFELDEFWRNDLCMRATEGELRRPVVDNGDGTARGLSPRAPMPLETTPTPPPKTPVHCIGSNDCRLDGACNRAGKCLAKA